MKFFTLIVFAALAAAQQPPPARTPTAPPSAPATTTPTPSATPSAPAVAPGIPNLPDDTVVATFDDGTNFTVGDFRRFYYVMPAENQQMALRDRAQFIRQFGLLRKLMKLAEERKLDQRHPNSDALEYYRMFILGQAMVNDMANNVEVKPDDVRKYYDENQAKYKQARVKTIYIAFSAAPTPANGKAPANGKVLTEAQAKTKMEKLAADIRNGADFVQLVKQYSEDESRSRDGDFATLRPNDNIPDAIKDAVFALKKGEITDPIRQPNGFYIFRAEDISPRPFEQVQDEIFNTLKQKAYSEWFEKTNNENKVTYHSPEFLGLMPFQAPPPKQEK